VEVQDPKQLRNAIRAKALASPRQRRFERFTIAVNGEPLELEARAPTLAEKETIREAAMKIQIGPDGKPKTEISFMELGVQAAIHCIYTPGTDERVFEAADAETIRTAEAGSWMELITEHALRVMNSKPATVEAIEKNSVTTPAASSSSA
jgi:hypothetical protein